MVRWAVAAWVVAVVLSGCTFRMGDLSLVSTRNVALNLEPIQHGVEGRDCSYRIFGVIPTGSVIPNVEDALDRAVEKVPEANLLTNVALYSEAFHTGVLSVQCLKVRGDAGELR